MLTCIDCCFYDPFDDTSGWCRINPPTFALAEEGLQPGDGSWPKFSSEDWCGKGESE